MVFYNMGMDSVPLPSTITMKTESESLTFEGNACSSGKDFEIEFVLDGGRFTAEKRGDVISLSRRGALDYDLCLADSEKDFSLVLPHGKLDGKTKLSRVEHNSRDNGFSVYIEYSLRFLTEQSEQIQALDLSVEYLREQ